MDRDGSRWIEIIEDYIDGGGVMRIEGAGRGMKEK